MQNNHLCAVGAEALTVSLAHSPARDSLKVLDLLQNSIGSTASVEATGGREGVLAASSRRSASSCASSLLLDDNELEWIARFHMTLGSPCK